MTCPEVVVEGFVAS